MSWDKLLEDASPNGHFVQLHKSDEYLLAKNVGDYIRDGLKQGDGLLVIAIKEHSGSFARCLREKGIDAEAAVRAGRLVALDSDEALDRCMVGGLLDWTCFDRVIGGAVRQVAGRSAGGRLRAYQDMAGVLWKAGHYSTAIRLDRFWKQLLSSIGFNLFCSYPIDVFDREFRIASLDALLRAHTHLLPSGTSGDLENAINRAMDEVLGPRVDDLRLLIKANYRPSWAVLPRAEAIVLWLRNNLPEDADAVLSRARHYYTLSRPAGLVREARSEGGLKFPRRPLLQICNYMI